MSVNQYGASPFLYPLYGLGGLPEGFSRLCAIKGGVFMLNHSPDELLFDDEQEVDNTETENGEMLDIQKELEAKFDELFGSIDDENDDNE